MKKEFDDFLVKRYPQLFKERKGDPSKTAMTSGFQCGDGWFNLLNMLCSSIENHIKSIVRNNEYNQRQLDLITAGKMNEMTDWMRESFEKGELVINKVPDVTVIEVKEKFGELRFSVKGADDRIRGMINMANSMSSVTCEECGKPGQVSSTNSGWIRVLCNEHNPKSKPEIQIKSTIRAVAIGELINLEVVKIINKNEFIGLKIHDYLRSDPKDQNKPPQYFVAKYIENEIHSYWDAAELNEFQ